MIDVSGKKGDGDEGGMGVGWSEWCAIGEHIPGAEEGAEKVGCGAERFPQWLKPHCRYCTCGAAEAAPFQDNAFFSTL